MVDLPVEYRAQSEQFKGYLAVLVRLTGLSKVAVADKLGVSKSVLYRWLNANQHELVIPLISLQQLLRLAGIDVEAGLDERITRVYGDYMKLRWLRENILGAPSSRPISDTMELYEHLRDAERRASLQKG